jgi:hypothetical protein
VGENPLMMTGVGDNLQTLTEHLKKTLISV